MYKFITKNLSIKIICLVGAAILWVYVASSQNSVAKFPGSIEIKMFNTQTNLMAIYDIKEVEIKVMTDTANWRKLSTESFSAYVDLSSYSAGTYEVPITVVSSISGVQIVEKKPDKILVSIEPIMTKEIPILKKIEGAAAEGMTAGTVVLSPDKATIRGAKSLVENISEASAKITLNGESTNFSRKVSLEVLGSEKGSIEIDPKEVEAKVSIIRGANIKSVGIKPNIVGVPKTNYYISDITVTPSVVDITGAIAFISNIKLLETSTIDIGGMTESVSKTVLLKLPEGVTLSDTSSSSVVVEIKLSTVGITRDLTTSNFKYLNNKLDISTLNPKEVVIKCIGVEALLDNLDPKDISVNLDFNAKTPNTLGEIYFDLLPSDITLPPGVEVVNIITKNMTAKVK